MGRRELGRWSRALLAVLAASACSRGESSEGRAAQPSSEAARPAPIPAAAAAFRVELPPPTADGPRATLTIALTDEHLAAAHGAGQVEVRGGEAVADTRRTYALAADERELQRLTVGGRTVLTYVQPNATLWLVDQPCFGWELVAPWLDSAAHATRPDERGECPAPASRKVAADYRCPADTVADEHCCLRTAVLTFADGKERLVELTGPGGGAVALPDDGAIEVVPGGCGFHIANTAAGEVGLAIGFGARWQLAVDDAGVVSGRQLAAP